MQRLTRNELRGIISERIAIYLKQGKKTSVTGVAGRKQLNEILSGKNAYKWEKDVEMGEGHPVRVEGVIYFFKADSGKDYQIYFWSSRNQSAKVIHYTLTFGFWDGPGLYYDTKTTDDYDMRVLDTIVAATRDFVMTHGAQLHNNEHLPEAPIIITYSPEGDTPDGGQKRAKVYTKLLSRHLPGNARVDSLMRMGGDMHDWDAIFIPTR